MPTNLLRIHPQNPERRKIEQVSAILRDGGVVIYPTDTVYGLGCDIFNAKAVERVKRIKGEKGKSSNIAFICYDLSELSKYARSVDTPTFKLMKRCLPGPYTFILNASSQVPKLLNANKKTVGIRVPDHLVPREIVRELGHPIATTSIDFEDEPVEYHTDPSLIAEKFNGQVDLVVDSGYGNIIHSTVLDCTGDTAEVIRHGLGEIDL